MVSEIGLSVFWLTAGLLIGSVIMKDFRSTLLEIERDKKRIIAEEHNRLLIENKKLECRIYDLSTGNRFRSAG